jgi:soluble lytic murein transglycosylase-like protein
MIKTFVVALSIFGAPIATHAQVIEIDDSGAARTFDGPTVFAGTDSQAIRPATARLMRSPAALLNDAAKAHGLDRGLLEALAWQESRGRTAAVSPKGAIGVMQLMPGTAAELGVRIDDVADNIRGGALYLRRQLDRFGGSVPLALAAYNAGPGSVIRYGGVPPYRETQNYVARIMQRWRPGVTSPAPAPANPSIIEVPSL